jgi:hypothetical protein
MDNDDGAMLFIDGHSLINHTGAQCTLSSCPYIATVGKSDFMYLAASQEHCMFQLRELRRCAAAKREQAKLCCSLILVRSFLLWL